MKIVADVPAILANYRRHGWTLRRVLLSGAADMNDQERVDVFGDAELRRSDLDAMWFERRSVPGKAAWELRALSSSPLALVALIPDDAGPDDVESLLADTQDRLRQMLVRGTGTTN